MCIIQDESETPIYLSMTRCASSSAKSTCDEFDSVMDEMITLYAEASADDELGSLTTTELKARVIELITVFMGDRCATNTLFGKMINELRAAVLSSAGVTSDQANIPVLCK